MMTQLSQFFNESMKRMSANAICPSNCPLMGSSVHHIYLLHFELCLVVLM